MFGKKKPSWRTAKVEEFLDDFSIWAKHTGNQDWVGFAENKITQLAQEKDRPSEDYILEELIKVQETIRKLAKEGKE